MAQRKIVTELTWANSAASSTLNMSTGREQLVHHSDFRDRLKTIIRSISNVISVRVFMTFPFRNEASAEHHGVAADNSVLNFSVPSCIHCIPPK